MLLSLLGNVKRRLEPAQPGRFVALDMDSRHLRIVCAEPRRDLPKFKKLTSVPVPAGLDHKDPKAVGAFIGEALKSEKLHGLRVLMDVPRSKSILKTLTLPPVDSPRELPGMVRFQVEAELPFPVDEAVIDFTVERHFDAGQAKDDAPPGEAVLVAVVRSSVVEHYQQVAEAAGVRLQQLGLRPYADVSCLQACLTLEQRDQTTALVHITGDEAEINVLVHGLLAFSRSAAVKMPPPDAEGRMNRDALDATTKSLVVEIVRSLGSAQAVQGGIQVERVVVSGDTTIEKAVADAVADRLNVPANVLDPTNALQIKRAKTDTHGFITALGLAIGHTATAQMPFNFLDPKRPPVERNVKRITTLATGGAIAALAAVTFGVGVWQLGSLQASVDEKVGIYNEREKQSKPVIALGKRLNEVEEWRDGGQPWLNHQALLSSVFPDPRQAYLTSLKTRTDGAIECTVRARTRDAITEAASRLKKAGYDVKMSADQRTSDEYGYEYTTTLNLAFDPKMKIDVNALEVVERPADDGSAQMIGQRRSGSSAASNPSSSRGPAGESSQRGPTDNSRDDDARRDDNDRRSNDDRRSSERRR